MDYIEKAGAKVDRARDSIAVAFPLFIRMLFETETIVNEDIDTLQTDGTDIEYSPIFVDKHKSEYTPFFVLHEFTHKFLGHCVRFNPAYHDENDFQLSADYAANDFLFECGVKLWPNCYYDRKYAGMSVEKIYDIIHKENQSKPEPHRQKFDPSSNGVLQESPDVGDEDSEDECDTPQNGQSPQMSKKRQEAIEESENKMRQAEQAARLAGTLSGDMEKYLAKLYPPQNNWQDILAELLIVATGMDDYTFTKANRRRMDSDFIFPSLQSEQCGPIVTVLDTSGSADAPDLDVCYSEIQSLSEDMDPEQLIAICCDNMVRTFQVFEQGEEPLLDIQGGWGTDFVPPFVRIEQEGIEPEVLIYLTDGFCNSFPPEPDYPVIWICWQDRVRFEPPFGEVIVMEGR